MRASLAPGLAGFCGERWGEGGGVRSVKRLPVGRSCWRWCQRRCCRRSAWSGSSSWRTSPARVREKRQEGGESEKHAALRAKVYIDVFRKEENKNPGFGRHSRRMCRRCGGEIKAGGQWHRVQRKSASPPPVTRHSSCRGVNWGLLP